MGSVVILAFLAFSPGIITLGDDSSNGGCPGNRVCFFRADVDLFIGTGFGGGMITITVTNKANLSFTDIRLSNINPPLNGLALWAPFISNNKVMNSTNVLSPGASSIGEYSFTSGGTVPTTYAVTVTVTLANGAVVTETGNIESYTWG